MQREYEVIEHNGIAPTGAKLMLDAYTDYVAPRFPTKHKGDLVYIIEFTKLDRVTSEVTYIREIYPTRELGLMGSAYWRRHPRYQVHMNGQREGTAKTQLVDLRPIEETNIEGIKPDTLAQEQKTGTLDRRPGESVSDAYQRWLDEEEEA